EVTGVCTLMIADCAKPERPASSEDVDWIAEGLSTLGFYLDPCLRGREPTDEPLKVFFGRIEKRKAPAGETVKDVPTIVMVAQIASDEQGTSATISVRDVTPSAPEAPKAVAPAAAAPAAAATPRTPRPEVNEELLEIYLFEAQEVLAGIDAALQSCRTQANDREALVTIRRGFHTLKGSGRMVGLTDLGEIAWEIEQLMNRWLEQERPASPALLDVISTSSTAFAGWVAVLQAGNWPTLDAERIVDYARKLKAGEDPGAPLAGPAVQQRAPAEAAPQPAPTPEPEELLIGGVSL